MTPLQENIMLKPVGGKPGQDDVETMLCLVGPAAVIT